MAARGKLFRTLCVISLLSFCDAQTSVSVENGTQTELTCGSLTSNTYLVRWNYESAAGTLVARMTTNCSSEVSADWAGRVNVTCFNDGNLLFYSVNVSDTGTFYCYKENVLGDQSTTDVQLQVYSEPSSDTMSSNATCEGDRIVLNCTALVYPATRAELYFIVNGTEIYNTTTTRPDSGGEPQLQLIWSNLTISADEDGWEIQCVADWDGEETAVVNVSTVCPDPPKQSQLPMQLACGLEVCCFAATGIVVGLLIAAIVEFSVGLLIVICILVCEIIITMGCFIPYDWNIENSMTSTAKGAIAVTTIAFVASSVAFVVILVILIKKKSRDGKGNDKPAAAENRKTNETGTSKETRQQS